MGETVEIRRLAANDAEACGRIIYDAFKALAERHHFPPDFPSAEIAEGMVHWLLKKPTIEGLVAEMDGRPVGCNFIDLARPVAGVGPIAVAPSAEAGGIGGQLMRAVMDLASVAGIGNIRLAQAAYNNASLSLYTKLGFRAQTALSVLQGPPLARQMPGYEIRHAEEADVAACDRLCHAVHGFERTGDLRAAIVERAAMVAQSHGRVVGYTTGIGFAGHTVAEDNRCLEALISAAPAYAGPGFILPTANHDVLRWCLENGLRLVMQMTYMTIGLCGAPRDGWMPSILR